MSTLPLSASSSGAGAGASASAMLRAATLSPSSAHLQADRNRPRLSRRRERAEDEEDDVSEHILRAHASHSRLSVVAAAGAAVTGGDVSRDDEATRGRGADQRVQLANVPGKQLEQQEPARKRRKKRSSSGHAHERISLLGGVAAPSPWVVAEGSKLSRKLSKRHGGASAGGGSGALPPGLPALDSLSQPVDLAAMEAEGVDRQFADMLTEYLKLDGAGAGTQSADDAAGSSTEKPRRSPMERIIPGIRPRPPGQQSILSQSKSASALPADLSAYRDQNMRDGDGGGGNSSDASSDWLDEEEELANESDDSSVLDVGREGEDEDSNSEGFYRNDYPEGEGQDDDFEDGWHSDEDEEDGDDDDDAVNSDQYADEDD
ncbi:hypothetical protein OC834_007486 [Tilletia horrida]|nr:hypothetical protein OC834_007486 [Tilletia horrida]